MIRPAGGKTRTVTREVFAYISSAVFGASVWYVSLTTEGSFVMSTARRIVPISSTISTTSLGKHRTPSWTQPAATV